MQVSSFFFPLTMLQRCGMLLAAHSVIIPQSQPGVAPGVPSGAPPQRPGKGHSQFEVKARLGEGEREAPPSAGLSCLFSVFAELAKHVKGKSSQL